MGSGKKFGTIVWVLQILEIFFRQKIHISVPTISRSPRVPLRKRLKRLSRFRLIFSIAPKAQCSRRLVARPRGLLSEIFCTRGLLEMVGTESDFLTKKNFQKFYQNTIGTQLKISAKKTINKKFQNFF